MYKAIGFDLGGVMLAYSPAQQVQYLAEVMAVERPVMTLAYAEWRPRLDLGEITNMQFWEGLIQQTGSKLDPRSTEHLWNDGYRDTPVIEGMRELVDRLKRNGYKVGLLSNLDAEHTSINRQRGLFSQFDVALISNEIHQIKPQVESYKTLAQGLGVEPGELVFIDDLQTNIKDANLADCFGIVFTGYRELIAKLQQLGINCD